MSCFVSNRGRLGDMCGLKSRPRFTFVPSVLVEYRRRSRRLLCELLLQTAIPELWGKDFLPSLMRRAVTTRRWLQRQRQHYHVQL